MGRIVMRCRMCLLLTACVLIAGGSGKQSGEKSQKEAAGAPLSVALAETDITPAMDGSKPVYIAGYDAGRRGTGVHDPLMARAVVLKIRGEKIALVSVDLIGLHYPVVQAVRRELADYRYVVLASTHNHEGPDTIGIWGPSRFRSGVDPEYVKLVQERVVQLVRRAEKQLVAAHATYGSAEDATLLGDSRLPKVYDGVLRAVRFTAADSGKNIGLLVQWNCHPEALGGKNTLITADFPATTVEVLKKRYDCPVAYFTGTVGGLMAPPKGGRIKDAAGKELREGQFEYAAQYGREVALLASKAIDTSEPIDLSSLAVSARPIAIPLDNPLYKVARLLGIIVREGRVWDGDPDRIGGTLTREAADRHGVAGITEVGYVRLGELHIACIPGEIYPELVYGKFQEPAEPNADFPDAPLEKPLVDILPGKKILILGLANDEIGYIIPKRQWDRKPPYAYGREKSQYGEVNSCSPDVAPNIMKVLERRVAEATGGNHPPTQIPATGTTAEKQKVDK